MPAYSLPILSPSEGQFHPSIYLTDCMSVHLPCLGMLSCPSYALPLRNYACLGVSRLSLSSCCLHVWCRLCMYLTSLATFGVIGILLIGSLPLPPPHPLGEARIRPRSQIDPGRIVRRAFSRRPLLLFRRRQRPQNYTHTRIAESCLGIHCGSRDSISTLNCLFPSPKCVYSTTLQPSIGGSGVLRILRRACLSIERAEALHVVYVIYCYLIRSTMYLPACPSFPQWKYHPNKCSSGSSDYGCPRPAALPGKHKPLELFAYPDSAVAFEPLTI